MITLALIYSLLIKISQCFTQPNIVVILADDLGYNDVGYRGNNQVKTPNIDALAYNGAILNTFYTLPLCTHSRAAFLTGNYPIRAGMQGLPIIPGEERHIPWDMPIMPELLKEIGYQTHLVGKWHLGNGYKNSTPMMRSFDSHYGYYSGYVGYFDHTIMERDLVGLDFRNNFDVANEDTGKYATDLFTSKSIDIIREHNYGKPLFLLLSHMAPHTGKTVSMGHTVLEEKDPESMDRDFGYIKDINRRKYADIVQSLDDSVGLVVKSLSERGVLDNTIILFLSDNGGQTFGVHENFSSNWPLRGLKHTLFEGAVKGTAIFYSKHLIYSNGTINNNLIHISDLLPTFYAAGGGNVADLGTIDGMDQSSTLFYNACTRRDDLLVNIDEALNMSAIISHGGRFKLVQGSFTDRSFNEYAGDTGRNLNDPVYDIEAVLSSDVNKALGKFIPFPLNKYKVADYRRASRIYDCRAPANFDTGCQAPCLFDLVDDPCETTNIAEYYPEIVWALQKKIAAYYVELVPQQNKPFDPQSSPAYFGGSWSTWLEENPV